MTWLPRQGGMNASALTYVTDSQDSLGMHHLNRLFIASSGGGKSVASAKTIEAIKEYEEKHKRGVVVIHLNDPRKNFEHMHCAFEPEKEYHLKDLATIKRTPKAQPIKIWTPLTKDLPTKKYAPEQNLFTIPMEFNENDLKILIEPKQDKEAGLDFQTAICLNILSRLKKDEDLIDFLIKINEHEDIGAKVVKEINLAVDSVLREGILRPKSDKLNLDIFEILNDPEHYHFLNLNYMNNKKAELFIKSWVINQIFENAKKSKYRVIIAYSEIVEDTPRNALRANKLYATDVARSIQKFRGAGDFITDTQHFTKLQNNIVDAFNWTALGFNDSINDRAKLAEKMRYDAENAKLFFSLRRTEWLIKGEETDGVGRFKMPRHKMPEEGEGIDYFLNKWKSVGLPMKSYSLEVNEQKKHIDQEQKKFDKWKEEKKKIKEKPKKEDKEVLKIKKENEELKMRLQAKKDTATEERDRKILTLHGQINPLKNKPYSMGDIAKMVGVSKATIHKVIKDNEDKGTGA